jgi:alkylated DNA repair dioxygenase AlkB
MSASTTTSSPLTSPQVIIQNGSARVEYYPKFVKKPHHLFATIFKSAPFQAEKVKSFGKEFVVKRETCAYGEPGTTYTYAGKTQESIPFIPEVDKIRTEIEQLTGQKYNFVLANYYPDGQAYIGYHADDERDLEPNATIASISLGAVREFRFRHVSKSSGYDASIKLACGSLLLMMGATQQLYKHSIPKISANVCFVPRINLTFRLMRTQPSVGNTPKLGIIAEEEKTNTKKRSRENDANGIQLPEAKRFKVKEEC